MLAFRGGVLASQVAAKFVLFPSRIPNTVCSQVAVAAKFPPATPSAVSLFFPDGTEVDDDDVIEVGRGGK